MSVTSTMAHALCHRAFASCSRSISVSFSLLLPTCFPHSKFSFFCTSANTPVFWGKFDRLDKVQLNFVFFGINSLYKAKFLYSTLNSSKKFIPLKPEKRAVRFFIRIYPQYWVPVLEGISYQLRFFHIHVFCFQEISRRRFYLY